MRKLTKELRRKIIRDTVKNTLNSLQDDLVKWIHEENPCLYEHASEDIFKKYCQEKVDKIIVDNIYKEDGSKEI